MHGLPTPGEDFNYTEDRKDHHNASHQGEKSEYFYPLHLAIRVAKKKTIQSSTGWNNDLLTWKRDKTRSASIAGGVLQWPKGSLSEACVYPIPTLQWDCAL